MDCQETPEGYKVMYTPMAPGNYLIGVKYGGPNHIVGSPFKAKVTGNQTPWKYIFQDSQWSRLIVETMDDFSYVESTLHLDCKEMVGCVRAGCLFKTCKTSSRS